MMLSSLRQQFEVFTLSQMSNLTKTNRKQVSPVNHYGGTYFSGYETEPLEKNIEREASTKVSRKLKRLRH